jgi:NMD protein affecting ribosome stability and mRNA decay
MTVRREYKPICIRCGDEIPLGLKLNKVCLDCLFKKMKK